MVASTLFLVACLISLPRLSLSANQVTQAGVVNAILEDSDIGDCAAKSKLGKAAFVAKAFELKNVTLKSGERMTVATGMDQCVCAAENCPTVVVLAAKDGTYRTVLSGFTIEAKISPDGTAVLSSHDSAAVSDRSSYRWNGKTYAATKAERVDARSGTVKPMFVPVAFAAGSSSATLSGKAALGFGDTYSLDATAGQTMELALSAPPGKSVGHLAVFRGDTIVAESGTHWRGKLPANGTYRIGVDGAGETLEPYTLKITIR